jgi:hypothetical protein
MVLLARAIRLAPLIEAGPPPPLEAKYVSVSVAGDGDWYEALFEAEDGSDIDLLRYGKGVVDLNGPIPSWSGDPRRPSSAVFVPTATIGAGVSSACNRDRRSSGAHLGAAGAFCAPHLPLSHGR